jgi:crotonobetainyl-CoA:carnitine CoA-transferase CaiB-like acyl-CoA transferase
VAGLFATWALLTALYHRDVHGGPGQVVDVSLYESMFSILGPLPALYKHEGYLQQRRGSRLSFSSPRNVYRTRDGAYFAVSGTASSAAEIIIRLVGGDELLLDARFATHDARAIHADDLDAIVSGWIAARDVAEVDALFQKAGAAGMRVLTMEDVFSDPHYSSRGTVVDVPDGELGTVALAAPVPRMEATPGRVVHPGPPLGRDTNPLLRELGYSDSEIAAGREEGVW